MVKTTRESLRSVFCAFAALFLASAAAIAQDGMTPTMAESATGLGQSQPDETNPAAVEPKPNGAKPAAARSAEGDDRPIETKADSIDFHGQTKRVVAEGNVVITYHHARVTADKVSVDNVTKDIYAEGNVHIYRDGNSEWHGDQVQFNMQTGAINAGPARAYSDEFYLSAGKTESTSREYYILRDSEFTTSEYQHPTWKWKCGSIVYYPHNPDDPNDPDGRVVFRNAVLYAGDVPVFYFPYLQYDLKDIHTGVSVVVGQRSTWGPYILARYRLREDKYLWPIFKLDYRYRRGVGGGADLEYGLGEYENTGRPGKLGHGRIETYYTDDKRYREDPLTDVPRPDRPGVRQVRIDPRRYRVKLEQKYNPLEDLNTTLKIDVLSDEKLLEEFFEKDLQKEQFPDNFLEVQKYDENWTINLVARPQFNKFVTTTERLPELSLNVPRQQVAGGIYYESASTVGSLSKKFYDDSFPDFNSKRVDSFHQFTYPMKWFDWLNVVPRVGGRGTFYTHSRIDGTQVDTSLVRSVFNTGVEFSTKMHRTWPGVQNHAFQIDGLRHIIEPSLNYVWVPRPEYGPWQILQFDPGVPSNIQDKLRPIDFPQDVGVDNIFTRNVFRPTFRNRWQTKRGGEPYNFLDTVIYQDLNIESRSPERVLSNLFWAIDFKPTTWLRLSYESQYNYYQNVIRESNASIVYQYFKDWEIGISHRYFKGQDDNEISPSFKWRLNEDWAFRTEQRIGQSDGRLRESVYTVDRDLSAWIVTWSVRHLQPVNAPHELQVWMMWTLKEFPELTVQISQ